MSIVFRSNKELLGAAAAALLGLSMLGATRRRQRSEPALKAL